MGPLIEAVSQKVNRGASNPGVPHEVLAEALRKRLARIEEAADRLRQRGLDVDSALDAIHRDPDLIRLWRQIDSNILERSAERDVSMDEALAWLEALDTWAKAVLRRLNQLGEHQSGS